MRRSIQVLANRKTMPNYMHYPLVGLSKVYQAGLAAREVPYTLGLRKPRDLQLPTISVGNITWGGTGKTPMVERLCKLLLARKRRPLVLVPKYGDDEEHQLAVRVPGCVVVASKDREQAALAALAEHKDLGVVIIDDGLQQKRIKSHLNITMVNALNPFGNMHLIPRGILREPPAGAIARTNLLVLHNCEVAGEDQRKRAEIDVSFFTKINHALPIVRTGFRPLRLMRYTHTQPPVEVPLDSLRMHKTYGFSGIGCGEAFMLHLRRIVGKRVPGTQFEDHHCFTAKDMETVKVDAKGKNSTIIVTTQKDFLRRGGVDLVKELGTLHVLEGEINILQGAQILYKVVDSLLSSTGPKEIQVPV